jgi:hypothetical protein
MEPSGAMILERPQAPGVHRDVVIHQHAERIEAGGAGDRLGRVEVVGLLRRRAGEIDGRLAVRAIHADRSDDARALIELDAERGVCQPRDHATHALLGVVLHVAHVGFNNRERELVDHLAHELRAARVRRDLRFQISDVLGLDCAPATARL